MEAEILIQNKIDYEPKVSVVIPVYNKETYLRECLNSVINQTLKEIEIICVDDGSTDGSLEILKEYAQKDDRISVLTQKNLFAGVARNSGITVAKGEYISFLDADDFFELETLEDMFSNTFLNGAEIGVFSGKRIDYAKNKIFDMPWLVLVKNEGVHETKNLEKVIFQTTSTNCWNKIFSRKFIEKEQLRFQRFKYCNDVYFVMTALAKSNRIYVSHKKFANYRYNTGLQLASTLFSEPYSILTALNAVKEQISDNNLMLNSLYNASAVHFVYQCKNSKIPLEEYLNGVNSFYPDDIKEKYFKIIIEALSRELYM